MDTTETGTLFSSTPEVFTRSTSTESHLTTVVSNDKRHRFTNVIRNHHHRSQPVQH